MVKFRQERPTSARPRGGPQATSDFFVNIWNRFTCMNAWQSASMAGIMAARPSPSRASRLASAPGGSPIRAFESTTTFLGSLLFGARGASTVITSTGSGDHYATGSGDPPGHLQLGVACASWLETDPRPQPHLLQPLGTASAPPCAPPSYPRRPAWRPRPAPRTHTGGIRYQVAGYCANLFSS